MLLFKSLFFVVAAVGISNGEYIFKSVHIFNIYNFCIGGQGYCKLVKKTILHPLSW